MKRPLFFAGSIAGLALLPLLAVPVLAQETPAPAEQATPPAEQPAFSGELDAPTSAGSTTLDGAAVPALTVPPNPRDLLTGLYATRGLAEICGIAIDAGTQSAMDEDEAQYVASLGITREAADKAYGDIKTALEASSPDCNDGSGDVAGVTQVLDLYASEPEGEAAAPAEQPAQ